MEENSGDSKKDYIRQSLYLFAAGGLSITLSTCIGQYVGSYTDTPHLIEGAKAARESFSFLGLNAGGLAGLIIGVGVTSFGAERYNRKEDRSSGE